MLRAADAEFGAELAAAVPGLWLGPVEAVPLGAAHWLAKNADSVVTSAEVGRMLGVDGKYVKNLVARGKLEPLARGVKPLRFKRSVVKAYTRGTRGEAREKG